MSIRIYSNIVRNISGAFWLRDQQSKVSDFTAQICEEIKSYWPNICQMPKKISNNHRHVEALRKNGRNALKNVNTHTHGHMHTHKSKEINKKMDPSKKKKNLKESPSKLSIQCTYLTRKRLSVTR